MSTAPPEFSVVLTVVEGPEQTRRCLEALRRQIDPPRMEILVPWDASIAEVAEWSAPGLRCPRVANAPPLDPPHDETTRHVLYDLRRSTGIAGAKAPRIALLEDRGVPGPDWARAMVKTLDQTGAAAVGGAIRCGGATRWARALHLLDFGPYAPPFDEHLALHLSDTNVAYRKDALERIDHVWRARFHEPRVHGALREIGENLVLSPAPEVVQSRADLTLGRILRERLAWGRLFGSLLARGRSAPWRFTRGLAALLLLPALLPFRAVRREAIRGRLPSAVRLLPELVCAATVWAIGEAWGLVDPVSTSRPGVTDEPLGEENPA